MDTNTAAIAAPFTFHGQHPAKALESRYVVIRHSVLNVSAYRVTPQADGMELVEYLRRDSADHADAVATTEEVGYYDVPRLVPGIHRATVPADAAQLELRDRYTAQGSAIPAEGDRYVVAQLTGYQLVQNRALDHRDCACGNGVTTYAEGTVAAVHYYADNSIEATITLDDGHTTSVTLVAPHGDACF